MNKILNTIAGSLDNLFNGISGVLDKTITTDKERLAAKAELSKLITSYSQKAMEMQGKVLMKETQGNWLQRSWRPILMLAFGAIVVYSKFLAPAFGLPNTELEPEFWKLLSLGMGGYVIGRSGEKIVGNISNNLDKIPGKKSK